MTSNTSTPLLDRKYLPGPQVMKLLGYSNPAAFYSFVRAERLPFVTLNRRRIVFEERELTSWLDRRASNGGAS